MNEKLKALSFTENKEFRLFFLKYIDDIKAFIKVNEEFISIIKGSDGPLSFIKEAVLEYKKDNSLRAVDISPERLVGSPYNELYDFLKTPSPFDIEKEPFKSLNIILNDDILQIAKNISNKGLNEKESLVLFKNEILNYSLEIIFKED